MNNSFLIFNQRPRRNRKLESIRDLLAETHLSSDDFICPFFIKEGTCVKEEITSLPNVYRWSLDLLIKEIRRLRTLGLKAVMLFPVTPQHLKDENGSYALNEDNILCKAIREIKKNFPNLCVISDLALDPYTTHGHDGLMLRGEVLNDETVHILASIAVLHAKMGVDIVAPSDMMDGRVGYIRSQLDISGEFSHVSILSYSVKFASSLYAPFRDALSSHPQSLDKKTYQMDYRNAKEALREIELDEQEGADLLMIKPAGLYLDILYRVREKTNLPLVAYQVSGEYAMIMAAENLGIKAVEIFYESLTSIKRAGANVIISYATPLMLEKLFHREF